MPDTNTRQEQLSQACSACSSGQSLTAARYTPRTASTVIFSMQQCGRHVQFPGADATHEQLQPASLACSAAAGAVQLPETYTHHEQLQQAFTAHSNAAATVPLPNS